MKISNNTNDPTAFCHLVFVCQSGIDPSVHNVNDIALQFINKNENEQLNPTSSAVNWSEALIIIIVKADDIEMGGLFKSGIENPWS